MKFVGEGSLFERGPHVPVTHLAFFNPPVDAFYMSVQRKDRWSAKEWEYVNAADFWANLAITALNLAKGSDGDTAKMAFRLAIVVEALKANREELKMRAQYLKDITEQVIEVARQMSFLVEQSQYAVFSESNRSARETLTAKIDVEAAKQLAKTRLRKANKRKKKKKRGAVDSDGASSE